MFKFKEYNIDSKQCRLTSLAPMFGNPPTTLLPIPIAATVISNPHEPFSNGCNGEMESKLPDEEAQEETAKVEPVSEYFAFSTASRVIGLSAFPLTGDPSQV